MLDPVGPWRLPGCSRSSLAPDMIAVLVFFPLENALQTDHRK
jgi:hypothetical protein